MSVVKRVQAVLDANAKDELGGWLTETFVSDLRALLDLAEAVDHEAGVGGPRTRVALRAVTEEQ